MRIGRGLWVSTSSKACLLSHWGRCFLLALIGFRWVSGLHQAGNLLPLFEGAWFTGPGWLLFNLVFVLPRLWPVRKPRCCCVLLECMSRARLHTKSTQRRMPPMEGSRSSPFGSGIAPWLAPARPADTPAGWGWGRLRLDITPSLLPTRGLVTSVF